MECSSNGIISRIGGDEFVILLPNTSEIEKIIKRIKLAIENEKTNKGVLSISIGAAVKKNKYKDIDEIFKKAEADMYRKVLSSEDAVRELKKHSGSQFDSKIVEILVEKVLTHS